MPPVASLLQLQATDLLVFACGLCGYFTEFESNKRRGWGEVSPGECKWLSAGGRESLPLQHRITMILCTILGNIRSLLMFFSYRGVVLSWEKRVAMLEVL